MNCAWNELLAILPRWLGQEADAHKNCLQELRLRIGQPPQLIQKGGALWLTRNVTADDLNFCVNTASRYSPWAAQSSAKGYITAPGGHRIVRMPVMLPSITMASPHRPIRWPPGAVM